MKARYTRGVIARSLIFLATAVVGLESRAQETQSGYATDFWKQQQNVQELKAFQDAKRGDYNAALRAKEGALGSAVISDIWQRNAADERKRLQKQYQEQLDQIQRNQEEILRRGQQGNLENRARISTPVIQQPEPSTDQDKKDYDNEKFYLNMCKDRLDSINQRTKFLIENENYRNLPQALRNVEEMLKWAKNAEGHIQFVIKSKNPSFEQKRLYDAYSKVFEANTTLAKAYEARAQELMVEEREQQNPDYWLGEKVAPHAARASELFELIKKGEWDRSNPEISKYLFEARAEIKEAKKYHEIAKTKGEPSEQGKKVEEQILGIYKCEEAVNTLVEIKSREMRERRDQERKIQEEVRRSQMGFFRRLFN